MPAQEEILIKIKIDTDQLNKVGEVAIKNIDELKKSQEQLKKSGQENTVQFRQNAEAIKLNTKQVNDSAKALAINDRLIKENKGSINALRQQLTAVTVAYNGLSKEERENRNIGGALSKQKLELTNKLKGLEEATGDHRRSVGDYSKALGSVPFGSFIKGIINTGKAFLLNPIGLIITAIVAALAALKAAFTAGEEGQDKMSKAWERITTVAGSFLKILEPIANFLFDQVAVAFEAVGKAAGIAGHMVADALALFGFDKAAKAVDTFVDSTAKAVTSAGKIADMRDKANDLETELILERAKLQAKIEDAKQKANDIENVSASERRKAIKEAIELTNQLAKKEEERATLLVEAKKLENKETAISEEDKKELAQLESELFNIQRERSTNIIALQKQEKKGNAELKEMEKERFEIAQAATKKQIELINAQSIAWTEAMKKRVDEFNATTKAEADRVKLITDIELERANFIKGLNNETTQGKINNLDLEEKRLIDGLTNENFLLTGQLTLTEDFQKQKTQIEDEFSQRRRSIQQAEVQANIDFAKEQLASLSIIAGENFEAQKGIAILQVALDEAKAISSLIASSTDNPLNSVTFGAAGIAQFAAGLIGLAANIAKVRQIINSQPPPTPPKAEKGIILGGNSHANGGTIISADGVPVMEAERGELLAVVNKKSTAVMKNLSNWNQMNGWGIPLMANGGSLPVINNRTGTSSSEITAMIQAAFKNVNIVTRITDINRVNNRDIQNRVSSEL